MKTLTSAQPSTVNAGRTSPRFHLLDGLRLFAAAAVVAYHLTAYPTPHWGDPVSQVFPDLPRITGYGALGVQLFFVISGFVILLSAWDRSIPSFVASRIARVYPAYWAAVLLMILLVTVIWPEGKEITLQQVLVNLTMLQTGFQVPDIDGVYWTLWTELCFYVLIAAFMRLGITTNRVLVFCAAWPFASAFAVGTDNLLVSSFLMPRFASLFAGGMLIYVIYREGHSVIAWLLLAVNVVLAGNATYRGTFQSIQTNIGEDLPELSVWLVVLGVYAAVAVVTLTPLRRVSWRWLTTAGALTYPLYLVHEYWGLWIVSMLYPTLPGRVVVAVAFLAVVALAWGVHCLVERPFAQPLRRSLESGIARMSMPDVPRVEDSRVSPGTERVTHADRTALATVMTGRHDQARVGSKPPALHG